METVSNLADIDCDKEIAITIGNFDGVHLGHKKVLSSMQQNCKNENFEFIVLTFSTHPSFVLRPKDNFLLTSYTERNELISKLGIKWICELEFTRDFSTKSPKEFLEEFIFINDKIKKIYVGHDFAFGANKSGDYELVKELCLEKNIVVEQCEQFSLNEKSISSTQIRSKIQNGEIEQASKLLDRFFSLNGPVIKGEGRGKQIGFATANIFVGKEMIIPKKGVYITKTTINDMNYHSVTNIGINPTFKDNNSISIETHILDFDKDIYGENLKVEFIKKLRDEKKFSSVNELIAQIKKDVVLVKEYFLE